MNTATLTTTTLQQQVETDIAHIIYNSIYDLTGEGREWEFFAGDEGESFTINGQELSIYCNGIVDCTIEDVTANYWRESYSWISDLYLSLKYIWVFDDEGGEYDLPFELNISNVEDIVKNLIMQKQ